MAVFRRSKEEDIKECLSLTNHLYIAPTQNEPKAIGPLIVPFDEMPEFSVPVPGKTNCCGGASTPAEVYKERNRACHGSASKHGRLKARDGKGIIGRISLHRWFRGLIRPCGGGICIVCGCVPIAHLWCGFEDFVCSDPEIK